jgi:hypothetical protein
MKTKKWHDGIYCYDGELTVGDVAPLIRRGKEWKWIVPVKEIMIKVQEIM